MRHGNLRTLVAAACAWGAALLGSARAQDLTTRAGPQERPVCIINATVHTVSGETYEGGYVYFVGGVIQSLGREPLPAFQQAPEFVDAKGLHVYPGLVAPYTQLGLTEMAAVRASTDTSEAGEISPEATAATAVNPDSSLLPVTRLNGVLAAGVFPQGGMVPGRASVIMLEGWTSAEMTVKRDAGLVMNWPQMRTLRPGAGEEGEGERAASVKENLRRLRDTFLAAKAYLAAKTAEPSMPTDVRWEAMRGVLEAPAGGGPRTPVYITANDYDQIVAAVGFAREMGVRAVIVGGRDAWMCADLLKADDVAVIVNSPMQTPKRDDAPFDAQYALAKRLREAGVRFAIASGEDAPHERNLPYAAAMASAHGLDRESALKSVTLWAAEVLGVDATLGSLEVGKSATLILTDGDPLEPMTSVVGAFIDGRRIAMTSKQTELARKYREKYRQQSALERGPGRAGARQGAR